MAEAEKVMFKPMEENYLIWKSKDQRFLSVTSGKHDPGTDMHCQCGTKFYERRNAETGSREFVVTTQY